MSDLWERPILETLIDMQDGLVTFSTGGDFPEGAGSGASALASLRQQLLASSELRDVLPPFVKRYRDLSQFWQFIKHEHATWAARRVFIWESFRPAIELLEMADRSPAASPIGETLERFNPDRVHAYWTKALDRRSSDPEGAITAARSLLESTCKHVLEKADMEYPENADLPKLWALCAEYLNLAPHQHQEQVFKTILGNCQSVVNSLAFIRNKIGDAHGSGRAAVKPQPRHAELVVNRAGSMASFLVATVEAKKNGGVARKNST